MIFVRANSLVLLAALLSVSDVNAFAVTKTAASMTSARGITPTNGSFEKSRTAPLPLRMAEGESEDGTFVKSVFKKEIVYDEKTGRFFETGFGEGDCVPEEEYCYLDKDTGESIRLTVEEKERIFLDALQVSLRWSCVAYSARCC